MISKKKLLAVVLAACVTLSMTACGASGGGSTSSSSGETRNDHAVKVGTTIHTKIRAEADKKMHSVTYKVTHITRNQKTVKKYIKSYNNSGKSSTIGKIKNDALEYVVASYKVKFPSNFPEKEFGITNVALKFKITGRNGAAIKKDGVTYKGLSSTYEIGSVPMGYDFYAGSTYSGKVLFQMVKGYKDYELKEYYKSGGTTKAHYILGK